MSVVDMTAAGKNGVRTVIALGTMMIDVTSDVKIAALLDTAIEALPPVDGVLEFTSVDDMKLAIHELDGRRLTGSESRLVVYEERGNN
eukprot:gene21772-26189_t